MGRCIQMMDCDTGLIAELLKENREAFTITITKDALTRIKDALIEKKARESRIEVGDVVSDFGYHGEVVITKIEGNRFCGYYVTDGLPVKYLNFVDPETGKQKFKKIADSAGQWRRSRGGAYFEPVKKVTGGEHGAANQEEMV